ncbi:MAG: hypothetical protein GVY36_13815 [Verrucomicrobia bacterium]|jgi:hypothetical protein|nr:hypothetical protein [Verrucomicrobiota bacterium]
MRNWINTIIKGGPVAGNQIINERKKEVNTVNRRSFLTLSTAAGLGVIMHGSRATASARSASEHHRIGGSHSSKPKPPLGWNSFDSYGVYLHHEAASRTRNVGQVASPN